MHFSNTAGSPKTDITKTDDTSIHGTIQSPPRHAWVDSLRGIGIILVVFGHALAGMIDASAANPAFAKPWFQAIFSSIYVFHMPLFFFLSGIFVQNRIEKNEDNFRKSLITGIVVPYFLWSVIQTIIIWSASSFVNHPVDNLSLRLIQIIWMPPSPFWFLYGLFVMHVGAIMMKKRAGNPEFLIMALIGASISQLENVPGDVVAILRMTPYYAMGVVFGPRLLAVNPRPQLNIYELFIIFAAPCAMLISVANAYAEGDPDAWPSEAGAIAADVNGFQNFFAAALMTAALVIIAWRFCKHAPRWLLAIGRRTMPILVFHIIFIAGVRIVGSRFLGAIDANQLLFVMCVAGLLGPLVAFTILKKLGLSRITGLG